MATTFRLVARFAEHAKAEEVAKELRAFFVDHDEQERRARRRDRKTSAQRGFTEKYGLSWPAQFTSTSQEIIVSANAVVFFSGYCTNLDRWLPDFMKLRGAVEVEDPQDLPCVSVVASLDGLPRDRASELRQALARFVEAIADCRYALSPWSQAWVHGHAAMFSDERTLLLHAPITSLDPSMLQAWLVKRGLVRHVLRVCECADQPKFHAIGKARCLACHAALEYLSPDVHAVGSEQLECKACGGMFEVAAFLASTPAPSTSDEPHAHEALDVLLASLEQKKLIELSAKGRATLIRALAHLDASDETELARKIVDTLTSSDFVEEVYAADAVLLAEIRAFLADGFD